MAIHTFQHLSGRVEEVASKGRCGCENHFTLTLKLRLYHDKAVGHVNRCYIQRNNRLPEMRSEHQPVFPVRSYL